MSDTFDNKHRHAPSWLSHSPILTVDYEDIDAKSGYGDAKFMDLGQSTWDQEEISAKIWRRNYDDTRWSRQSEELPLSRVLDLATLVAAAATGKQSVLQEYMQQDDGKELLLAFIKDNAQTFGPKLDELRRILQFNSQPIAANGEPNIFSFATSELSQDAMFAWLLSWADPNRAKRDSSLHDVAIRFVKLLSGIEELDVSHLEAGRQLERIDVWAEVNDDIILIIEDKTGTTIHDEQLQRYKSIVENKYPNRIKRYAYVKTGNEPKTILRKVEDAGYRIILRKDILECLDAYSGDNILLCNYREHLRKQENDTQSFRNLPVGKWSWPAWEGFYKELENRICLDNWEYVSNPSGGFLGAHWHWVEFDDKGSAMFLLFEQGDLCFKICPECDKDQRSIVRNERYKILMEKAKDRFPEIRKPKRFGSGEYMTIAKIEPKALFGDGIIDMDSLISRLKQYEKLVDECCEHS